MFLSSLTHVITILYYKFHSNRTTVDTLKKLFSKRNTHNRVATDLKTREKEYGILN